MGRELPTLQIIPLNASAKGDAECVPLPLALLLQVAAASLTVLRRRCS
jgi:hypothetical protein